MAGEDNKNLNLRWIGAFNRRDWPAEAASRTGDYVAHMQGAPGPLDSLTPPLIRRSLPHDAEEMLAVAHSVHDWFDGPTFEEMADDLEDDPGVVALVNGRIVGWATWSPI